MATALHKIICCWWAWARTFTPELGIVGLDSTGSSRITQELANQKTPGLFSLSLRWTADWTLPALTWNWKGFVPENYLNGAHPTGNPHWDFPCEIWHFNRLTSLKTSLASQHGLALSLEFELPASQLTAPLLTTAVPSPALPPKDPREPSNPRDNHSNHLQSWRQVQLIALLWQRDTLLRELTWAGEGQAVMKWPWFGAEPRSPIAQIPI